jgi:shikimate dehydrogenase
LSQPFTNKGDSDVNFRHDLVIGVGKPIAENPTGIMMEAAFCQRGLRWRYLLIEAGEDKQSDILTGIRAMGIRGANFTVPHKVSIVRHVDELAASAQIIGAVNTVVVEDRKLIGHNTDGQGFLRSLRTDLGVDPADLAITILGAGGAARAVAVELALAGAAQITFINRTRKHASDLAAELGPQLKADLVVADWLSGMAVPAGTDILINATSMGLYPNTNRPPVDCKSIHSSMVVVDVIPNPPTTEFLAMAESRGARTLNGLGMLVNQGAIAFELWTGAPAPTDVMHQELARVLTPEFVA